MQENISDSKVPLRPSRTARGFLGVAVVILILASAGFLVWQRYGPRTPNPILGRHPEQLVYARAADDILNGGVMFAPPKEMVQPVAIIWIHGWGVNFYSPTYVNIGRRLAERGYTCISANTRMHDLGNVAAWRGSKRVRAGGYWGVASEEVRDLAAWIDLTEKEGFRKIVLVGHSAGWAAVRLYQASTQDQRVAGLVLASGAVRAETRKTDPDQLAQATRLMGEGKGDDLIRDPKRSFPSFISAATLLDIANCPAEFRDFFGTQTTNAGVARIRCPLLAFFGTKGDVGGREELETMKSAIARQPNGPRQVQTAMIQDGDHMYTGEEEQVAETIVRWIKTAVLPSQPGGNNSTHLNAFARSTDDRPSGFDDIRGAGDRSSSAIAFR